MHTSFKGGGGVGKNALDGQNFPNCCTKARFWPVFFSKYGAEKLVKIEQKNPRATPGNMSKLSDDQTNLPSN